MPVMTRPLLALALALATAACAPTSRETLQSGIALRTSEAAVEYQFSRGGTGLPAAQQQKLRRFLQHHRAGAGDRLVISVPSGASPAATQTRRAALSALVAPFQVQIEFVGDEPGRRLTAVDNRGLMRLIRASHMEIGCTSEDGVPARCAQRRNLAVMLADPNDLILPRRAEDSYAVPPRSAPDAE